MNRDEQIEILKKTCIQNLEVIGEDPQREGLVNGSFISRTHEGILHGSYRDTQVRDVPRRLRPNGLGQGH